MIAPCADRRSYPSRPIARREGKRITRRAGNSQTWREYKCRHCGFWHLTTTDFYGTAERPSITSAKTGRGRHRRGRRPEAGESVEELAEKMRRGG